MKLRLGFIILGIILISFAQSNKLTCTRTEKQGSCKLVRSGFLWSEEKELPVNKLRGAKFYSPKNDESSKVVINTSNSEVSFSSFTSYANENQQRAIASQINNFVRNSEQPSLQVEQNDTWWIVIGFISLAVGVYPLLKPKS
ncbi:MAG: hypothetical protein NHB32_23665 [Fischerella sp. CENA71]|nr:hypothetical protein [Fischerella sp. CENA71]